MLVPSVRLMPSPVPPRRVALRAQPEELLLASALALPLLRAALKPRRERRGPERWLNGLTFPGPVELRRLGSFGAEVQGTGASAALRACWEV